MDSEVNLTDKIEIWDQNLGKKSCVPDYYVEKIVLC